MKKKSFNIANVKYSVFLMGLLGLLFSVPVYAGATELAQLESVGKMSAAIHISYRGGLIHADFHNAPIRQALRRISAVTGVSFRIDKGVQGSVSFRTKGMDIEAFLRQVLRHFNHAFVFDEVKGAPELSYVTLFRRGKVGRIFDQQAEFISGGAGARTSGGVANASSGTSRALSVSHFGGSGAMTAGGRRRIAGINPRSFAGPGLIMREIGRTEKSISLIQRKMQGEIRAIKKEQAGLQGMLAQPGNQDKRKLIQRMQLLDGQLARARQGNVLMLNNEQNNLRDLLKMRHAYANPARQKQLWIARRNRQQSSASAAHGGRL